MSECKHSDTRRLIVCSHIVEERASLYCVIHEHDGDWQALCEHGAHDSVEEVRIACFECFRKRYPEFEAITGLNCGVSATIIKDEPGQWWIEPLKPEEKSQ